MDGVRGSWADLADREAGDDPVQVLRLEEDIDHANGGGPQRLRFNATP